MTKNFDVVVIGGGVMGASILFHLAQRGAGRMLLLEQSGVGAGSTGRSSGVIRMHYSTEVHTRLAVQSLPIWQHWADAVGAGDAGFVHTGFAIFSGAAYRPTLERHLAMQRVCGVRTSLISRDELREIAPCFALGEDEVVAYEPDSGYGDPSGAALGWITRARELGAEVRIGERVQHVELRGSQIATVRTATERFETRIAVLATGPWSRRVTQRIGLDLPLRATRHEVFMLRRNVNLISQHPGGADMANLTYFRPEAHDLTLVGNGNVSRDVEPDDYNAGVSIEYLSDLWSRLARRMPAIEDAEFTHGYAGLYTETPDSHPIVDRIPGIEGLYVCTGFSGHGFKLSPAIGRVMSELILDGEVRSLDISPLRADRFAEGALNNPQTTFRVMV